MAKPGTYNSRNLAALISFLLLATSFSAGQENAAPSREMKVYYLALLSRGPKWTPERTPETERIQADHMKNIQKMADDGKLIAAGPIVDDSQLRGIFVFGVATLEEARSLAEGDPAVKAGRLAVEVHPWFSQKGIGVKSLAQIRAHPEAKVEMVTYQLGLAVRGPKWTDESTPETNKVMADHLANVWKLIGSGKLGAAGPLTDGGRVLGIFVFQVGSVDEAKALAESDPAVKAGRMAVEMHPWMSAKGTLP